MSIKGRQPDMRMSLRLREPEGRRSRYLDMSPVEPGRQPDMRMSLRLREREARRSRYLDILPVERGSPPGRTPVSPICEWT